jgi:hypothetical protein
MVWGCLKTALRREEEMRATPTLLVAIYISTLILIDKEANYEQVVLASYLFFARLPAVRSMVA